MSEQNPKNPNEFFNRIESWLMRLAIFLLFLMGLARVFWGTVEKIWK